MVAARLFPRLKEEEVCYTKCFLPEVFVFAADDCVLVLVLVQLDLDRLYLGHTRWRLAEAVFVVRKTAELFVVYKPEYSKYFLWLFDSLNPSELEDKHVEFVKTIILKFETWFKTFFFSSAAADLRIGEVQWGDSGVYFCKVIISDDLEGPNEASVELLVLGELLYLLSTLRSLLIMCLKEPELMILNSLVTPDFTDIHSGWKPVNYSGELKQGHPV